MWKDIDRQPFFCAAVGKYHTGGYIRIRVSFALGNANLVSCALGDAKETNGNGFASQWKIGLRSINNSEPI